MRILVAPQEFKGTLTATQAAQAMARALRAHMPDVELDVAPIADGGGGVLDAVLGATAGSRRVSTVEGPLGQPVEAEWGILPDGAGVIEMAAASGLVLLDPAELDVRRASTYGTGQLIRAALDAGCARLLIGVGGSATNDGGAGAASALGVGFLDRGGRNLPPGGAALRDLARIDLSKRHPKLDSVELMIAVDVTNPLCGPMGASRIYGPQKGADESTIEELDAALSQLARVVSSQTGRRVDDDPGAGAAGGLAYGLSALCNGHLRPGFEVIASFLDLDRRLDRADLVATGEGRLDGQTAFGKGPGSLARLARRLAKRTVIFAGSVAPSFSAASSPFDDVVALTSGARGAAPSRLEAEKSLEEAVGRWAERLSSG